MPTSAWKPLLLLCALGWAPPAAADDDSAWLTTDPVPQWVWDAEGASDGQEIFLRKTFTLSGKIQSAKLYSTCDNSMTLWINGKEVGSSRDWSPHPPQ